MKKLLTIFFALSAFSVKAQLAVITDRDGFVNVRETGSIKSKIVGKLNSGDIVLYDGEEDGNTGWKNAFYSPENTMLFSLTNGKATFLKPGYVTGFVSNKGIVPIDRLPKMTYKKSIGYIGNNDTVICSFKIRPFISKRHIIHKSNEGCINCNKKFIDKIDNKKPWGIDGDLPKKEIYTILLSINQKPITIPLESFNDLYEATSNNFNVYYDNQGNIYLYMPHNSDGAGGYDVVWVVKDGKLIRRYVDSIG